MSRANYLLEIIRVSDKKHVHLEKRSDDLFITIEDTLDDDTKIEIKVEPKDLYEVKHGILSKIWFYIRTGQTKHYLMVVNQKGEPIKETAPEISGKVLRVARDWKGLGRAISDSFGSDLPLGRIAMVGGVLIGVAIVAYLISKGFIPMPESWGL